MQQKYDAAHRLADIATATSVTFFGVSVVSVNEFLQTIAFIVSIIAGSFAIAVYVKKLKK